MEVQSQGARPSYLFVFSVFLFVLLPFGNASATSGIANSVVNFCAPTPPSPSVAGCSNSACHSSNNPSNNDLTAAGMQSLNNPGFFCPGTTPAPNPTPTPTPNPTPTPGAGGGGSGMSGMSSGRRGSGGFRSGSRSGSRFGSRSSRDDDDDDDDRDDDDRDDDDDDRDDD